MGRGKAVPGSHTTSDSRTVLTVVPSSLHQRIEKWEWFRRKCNHRHLDETRMSTETTCLMIWIIEIETRDESTSLNFVVPWRFVNIAERVTDNVDWKKKFEHGKSFAVY